MKRDKNVDFLKGYACLLVIFGHVILGIETSGIAVPAAIPVTEKFLWSFHIDLFMFLSGFVYSLTGGWISKKTRFSFIKNKFFSLAVPYFVFAALYIIVNSLTPGVNNQNSLKDILTLWYKPIAQYWFIFALFWLFVIYTVFSKIIPNNIVLTAVLYAVFLVCKFFKINMFFLDSSFNCVLAFGIGASLKNLKTENLKTENLNIIKKIPASVRVLAVVIHLAVTVLFIKINIYNKFLVDDFLTVLGIFSSVCFISVISFASPVSFFLNVIRKYSFPLYLLHTFFTAATRILLLKIGVQNYILHIVAGIAAGIVFPVIIAKAAEFSPYLNFFFYPVNSVKKIKSRKKESGEVLNK